MDGRLPLYEADFHAWTVEQARLLREAARMRVNAPIDWEHIAEEVEDMGRSDRRLVNSALVRVIEHLLKLEWSPVARPRAGWRRSVREHRAQVIDALADSPSLRNKLDVVTAYRRARALALDGLAEDAVNGDAMPPDCPHSLDALLDEDWFPANRHGLE